MEIIALESMVTEIIALLLTAHVQVLSLLVTTMNEEEERAALENFVIILFLSFCSMKQKMKRKDWNRLRNKNFNKNTQNSTNVLLNRFSKWAEARGLFCHCISI